MKIARWCLPSHFAVLLPLLLALPAQAQPREVPLSQAQMQLSFAPVVKRAAPAVVNIYTSRKVVVRSGFSPLFDDPFFRQFFAQPYGGGGLRQQEVNSLGSGVIIDAGGMVVTSLHVVRGADDIRVVLPDRREFAARISVEDAASDLALLSIQTRGETLPAMPIVDSDALEVGDLVLAIGNPFGVGQTVTSGIVSGLARAAEGVSDYNFFIQTDAAINPGNSGGALVNMGGELIGINTAIYSRSGGSNGIGFAIPSNMVQALLRNRTEDGSVRRPWLGAEYQDITPDMAASLGLKEIRGVLLSDVYDDSPAKEAGLEPGDVVTELGGKPVETVEALRFRVGTAAQDRSLSLRYLRDGREHTARVRLRPAPEGDEGAKGVTLEGRHALAGVQVASLSPALALDLRLSPRLKGVVVLSLPEQAARSFVRPGDLITQCNGRNVEDVSDLQEALRQNGRALALTFLRAGNEMQLRVVQ